MGNQDRHHQNWGFILSKNELRLAPSFDHASGLASKVSDREAEERLTTKDRCRNVEFFCKRAKTPFFKESTKLKTFEVVKELCKNPQTRHYALKWIDRISNLKDFEYILHKIPSKFMTQNQKNFVIEMLKFNIREIKGLKDE